MKRTTRHQRLANLAATILAGALAGTPVATQAALLTLADTPLFLGGMEPNVFFQVDDSGSMDWEILVPRHPYYWTYWGNNGEIWMDSGRWLTFSDSGNCEDSRRDVAYIFRTTDNVYNSCTYYELDRNPGFHDRDWRGTDPRFNVLYYNPTEAYEPWVGMSDASFSSARSDPQPGSDGYGLTQNLGTETLINDGAGFVLELSVDDKGFDGTYPTGPSSANTTPNGYVDLWDSHVRLRFTGGAVVVDVYTYDPSASTGNCSSQVSHDDAHIEGCLGRTDPIPSATLNTAGACYDILGSSADTAAQAIVDGTAAIDATGGAGCRTIAEAEQNIANWYQYSRKRSYVTKGAIAALLDAIPGYRYGLTVINDPFGLFVEMPAVGTDYVTHNNSLIDDLFSYDWSAFGTPLRGGLNVVGLYYNDSLSGFGWETPIVESCQKNFALLFTDGYYNGGNPSDVADEDGDGIDDTLADVARKYYEDDLSLLPNDVPPDGIDPATHQHMVTMTVAFGVSGSLLDNFSNATVTASDPPSITGATGSGEPDGFPDTQHDGTLWTGGENAPTFDDPQEQFGWTPAGVVNSGDSPEKIDDLWHAAFNSKGVYINAQTPDQLVAAMQDALSNIAQRISSASSVALNSGSLNENTRTYQARFDSEQWTGQLLSIPISNGTGNSTCTTEAVGELCPKEWDAAEEMATQNWDTGREVLTYYPGNGTAGDIPGGRAFRWTNLNDAQKTALRTHPDTAVLETAATGEARLNYLRGDSSNEGTGLNFRDRNLTLVGGGGTPQSVEDVAVLGDIVQSSPVFVGAPSFGFPNSLRDGSGTLYAETYSGYITRVAAMSGGNGRIPMIYVGANDGMLHGINAYFDSNNDPGADSGKEMLAYVPNALYGRLPLLTSPEYEHKYFVNGNLTRADAYFDADNRWHTVIVGTLRGGGQGVFALDVTDPSTFDEANAADLVLWEFTDRDNPNTKQADGITALVDGDPDLGYTFSQAAVGRMPNGQWVAIFGNGHNNTEADGSASASGNAVLFIVDLQTGELVRKIDTGAGTADDPTGTGRPNALATVTPIDKNGDYTIETIYAGDLFGNIWKFDVSSASPVNWDVFNKSSGVSVPLFTTEDPNITAADDADPQPITTRIVTGPHPTDPSGVMLYFGTGKYLEHTDNATSNEQTQTFYGLWDTGAVLPSIDRADLLGQEILFEFQETFCQTDDAGDPVLDAGGNPICSTETVRVTSDEGDPGLDPGDYQINWASHEGWYMDLIVKGSTDNRGERVDADPLLRNGRIIFITTLPNESPCAFGGDSFLMELDANDGSRLAFTPFDLNNDGEFSEGDYVTVTIGGQQVVIPVSGRQSKQGIIQKPGVLVSAQREFKYASGSAGGIDITKENPGPLTLGRQSWRQLR